MRLRRFETVPVIFIITAMTLLIGLGIWQVQRLQWKNELITRIELAQNMPTLGNLPELTDPTQIDELSYSNVSLSGSYLHEKALHMVGRPKEAGSTSANGFFLITPFRLEDDGRVILVNRGFSLLDKETKPSGLQVVQGVLRPTRKKSMFTPDNKPKRNVWFHEDIKAMSKATGESLLPMIVQATGPKVKNVYPIPHNGKIGLRNHHLYYAITWFSIAIIGFFMFILYHRETEQPS